MLLVPIFQPEEFNGKLYTEYGYVLKQFAKYMTEIERLQVDLEKTHNQLVEVEKELEEWKEEARVVKKQRDEQLKSFRKGIEPYVDLLHMHETIAELKQRIAELESKESVKPMRIEFHADNGEMLTPLEVANSLITQNTFKVDELKELAEILEVYYRHHRDKNQDLDDLW